MYVHVVCMYVPITAPLPGHTGLCSCGMDVGTTLVVNRGTVPPFFQLPAQHTGGNRALHLPNSIDVTMYVAVRHKVVQKNTVIVMFSAENGFRQRGEPA